MSWEIVIGLEIHVQLATQSKIFSTSPTTYGAAPNTQANLVDLGFPGVLPVLNKEAVRLAVMFGLAVGADIAPRSIFARKNYFYPDLPKGYQISQLELPIVSGGQVEIADDTGKPRAINLTRAHLEEDAGKSLHENFQDQSGIDLNRAGTPLLEIVSEPELRSSGEAARYMRRVHELVRYLGVSDGNMQEGSFRCDANVSLRRHGDQAFGTRTEIKNLNSFRFIEKAIDYEVERQADILEAGGEIVQETRLYDADADETRSMRSKEEANDYRYFPDPDLLPVVLDEAYVDAIRSNMPELPAARRERFVTQYGLRQEDADILATQRALADYFEQCASAGDARLAANWILGEVTAAMNRDDVAIDNSPVNARALSQLISRIADSTISGKLAKQVFEAMWAGEGSADEIIDARGLRQITDTGAIAAIVDQVVADNPEQVQQFRDGKEKVLGYLVGQVMKASKGKANPGQVNELLRARLSSGGS
ncbi:MAG: Asp-tRNA(Asn)/Glu-tRNA(Gln) amidotransferase subunit GatB [Pseudomonadota bacterium]